ncbi:DinB family protein [Desertihabitans brevis]|uniref:DinB family protein n=1 Tax=Desertihabitans brevis TaxID=2268447 RepID=A0A367YUG8_9ACTN|nr:DinB family protein [Desertihabitans brevis]RCK69526.1 DinB family protein [Desertihabitans brevis]
MPLTPDTKDWTWVLQRPCAECGFDPAQVTRVTLAPRTREAARAVAVALDAPAAAQRPDDSTWSVLEYAAHVRDVCRIMGARLRLMLQEDDPLFANWDQDATAVEERYAEQDPAVVAVGLEQAAAELATAWKQVPVDAWDRPGRRSNGSVFTVWTLGVYALHDLEHHRHDVTR